MVIKKNNSREPFDRQKVLNGMLRSCAQRPVSYEQLEQAVSNIEQTLLSSYDREVSSVQIGELAMQELKKIDEVAYVRFASVYRRFADVESFFAEQLIKDRKSSPMGPARMPGHPGCFCIQRSFLKPAAGQPVNALCLKSGSAYFTPRLFLCSFCQVVGGSPKTSFQFQKIFSAQIQHAASAHGFTEGSAFQNCLVGTGQIVLLQRLDCSIQLGCHLVCKSPDLVGTIARQKQNGHCNPKAQPNSLHTESAPFLGPRAGAPFCLRKRK